MLLLFVFAGFKFPAMFRVCVLTCFELSFFFRLGGVSFLGACKY